MCSATYMRRPGLIVKLWSVARRVSFRCIGSLVAGFRTWLPALVGGNFEFGILIRHHCGRNLCAFTDMRRNVAQLKDQSAEI